MFEENYLRELGLDYWYLKKDASLLCVPEQLLENKVQVDVLCLCPKSWQENKKIRQLMFWFLKTMYNQCQSKTIYLTKDSEHIENQLNYSGKLVINFTQSTCQDSSRVIKINSKLFESMLDKPQLKKQVMLDVFRNSVSITRA